MKTIIALFDNLDEAEVALRDLQAHGVSRDHINLVASVADQDMGEYFDERGHYRSDDDNVGPSTAKKAGAGLSIGSLVAGLSLATIPGIGPLLAAGPLAAGVAGASAGAAGTGLGGVLKDAGVPEEEAADYQEAVRRGCTMLLVNAPDADAGRIADRLGGHRPADLEQRRRAWAHESQAHADHASRAP